MIRLLLIFAISIFTIHCSENPLFNAPELGKTHFILGLPAPTSEAASAQSKKAEPAVCAANDLQSLLACVDGSYKQAFFSPDDDLETILIKLINAEERSIRVAVFSFTNGDIANALILAHQRGIPVEIITDISCLKDKFNKIDTLKKAGIKIWIYNPKNTGMLNNIMHNKFVLFEKNVGGKSLLWTGSFNFTKSAKINNQENIIIVDEMRLIDRYSKQYALLKQRLKGKSALKLAHKKKQTVIAKGRKKKQVTVIT